MSKSRLTTIKGKRLVTGDPNLMTKDEICINATPNGVEVKEIGTDGKIKDLAGSNGGSSSGFKYESAKIIWEVDFSKNREELCDFLSLLAYCPIYATYSKYISKASGNPTYYKKFYGIGASFLLGAANILGHLDNTTIENINIDSLTIAYIEEAKGPYIIISPELTVTLNNLLELFELVLGVNGEELINVLESMGLRQISYEDFNPDIEAEIGNFLE